MAKIPKSKLTKFAGKGYKLASESPVEDNTAVLKYAAEDDLAGYYVDVQLAYNKEDKAYTCFAEFFKLLKKEIDFKAYSTAKKEFEESLEDDDELDEEDKFPVYKEKDWNALDVAKRVEVLETSIDMDSDFDVDEEDFDAFVGNMKEFGIDIPTKLKDALKK